MKSLVIVVTVLLSLALAQDHPRYSCPEEAVVITGWPIIATVPGVNSWEDCGESLVETESLPQERRNYSPVQKLRESV